MPVIDTNIVIDFMKGLTQADAALGSLAEKIVSVMTLSELLVGCDTPAKEKAVMEYLDDEYRIMEVDEEIAKRAAQLRRERRIKLPDAVILATALEYETYLLTRNIKDFKAEEGKVVIPYQL